MGLSSLKVAIIGGDARERQALASATQSAGCHVSLDSATVALATGRLGSCSVAIVVGDHANAAAAIRRAAPDLAIVAVLSAVDRRTVTTLLRAGVAGVVRRSELERALVPTVIASASGQLCIPRAFAAQAAQPPLSTREKQILAMVVLGFTNLEIAQQLIIAESTVKSHLHSAFRKLGVRTRVEAATLILDPANGLGTGILTIPTESGPQT